MPTNPIAVSCGADLDQRAADVYALVADGSRRPEWLPELRSTDAPPGRMKDGDRFTARVGLFVHELFGESEVVAAEESRALREQVVVGVRFDSVWTFVATPDGGTRIDHVITLDLPGGVFGRLERWLLGRRLAVMQRASLRRLQQTLSGESSRRPQSRWSPRRRG